MAEFEVYLEVGQAGGCMAHVLSLPGCHVAAADRQHALARLPQAIQAYYRDLIRHGEPVSTPEQIQLAVVEVQTRDGRFHPDDRSALFGPERRPMSRQEVARYLRLASFSRLDLLELVRGFGDGILGWKVAPEAMSIGRVLNHIGRAELWYISRISGPAADAPDWRALPTRRYLAQSRANASQRFVALSDAQLGQVFHPPDDDGDASEAWTARKALRRLLEHEREHMDHIREILMQWRQHLRARLAASRAAFIWQLVALDEADLRAPLYSGEDDASWSAWELLAHVADWDGLYARRTALVGRGRTAEIEAVDLEERNAGLAESRQGWTLDQALEDLMMARERYLVALGSVPDGGLHRRFTLHWGRRATLATWARWRFRHDDRHTKDLLAWRARSKPRPAAGPKSILNAALESGRQEMLTTAALVPAAERESRPLCGMWTLKDVLGHVADWEWYGVEGLDGPPSRRSLAIEFPGTIHAWNEAHAAARKDQPWSEVWADFQAARLALGQLLEEMSQEDLLRRFDVPWGRNWTAYRWIHLWLHHEREHAADLRANLTLPGWPQRLKQFA